jgi:hypothetical protein
MERRLSMRFRFTALLVAIMAVLVVSPAHAITGGEPDGTAHPYVGLVALYDAEGNYIGRCSGTLLSPTVVLTAGHCTYDAALARVYFDSEVTVNLREPGDTGVTGTPYTHPDYDPNAFYTHDLGVVVLDEPVYMDEYGQLPEVGQYDYLATQRGRNDDTFTTVGYGLQNANKNHLSALRLRMLAHPRLIIMNRGIVGDFSILMSNNANTGGICFGDSGGPLFYGGEDSNLLVGVTSFVLNSQCAGTGGVYRLDRADDLDWLYGEFGEYLEGYQ